MIVKRSFGVMRFLNRRHIWPVRFCGAVIGGLGALVCTGRLVLGQELFRTLMRGDFKTGGRRFGFYLHAGWPRIVLANDPFFNFAEGLDSKQLDVLRVWLERRESALPTISHAGHMMLVHAGLAHLALETGETTSFEAQLPRFKQAADRLLAAVQEIEPKTSAAEQIDHADTPGFAENAGQVLRDFEAELPIKDWKWFVIGGTFLGIVRDNAFLPHDVDLDVGLFLEGLDLGAFEEAFRKSTRFSIAKFDSQTEIWRDASGVAHLKRVPAMLKLVHSTGINLDVFLHERRDDKIWHGSGVNKWVNVPFGLSHYSIEDQDVLGPDNPDEYLREHYGEWRVVVKEFSCITGTTNLAFVKNLFTIAVLLKRFAYFSREAPAEAQKILRELSQQEYVRKTESDYVLQDNIV